MQTGNPIGNSIHLSVFAEVVLNGGDQVKGQMTRYVDEQIWNQVCGPVEQQVERQVYKIVKQQVRSMRGIIF